MTNKENIMDNENNQQEELNIEANPFEQDVQEEQAKEEFTEESAELEELKNKYQALEEQLEKEKAQYVRLAADFDNFRKRQEQERESLLKYGAEDTLKKLLPVLDTIQRAEKSFSEIDDCQQLKENFQAIQKQFEDCLGKIGLEKIETVGIEFDPNIHEAVMQTPSEEHDDNSVIAELQTGYKLHDRIVRPAMVNVAVKD